MGATARNLPPYLRTRTRLRDYAASSFETFRHSLTEYATFTNDAKTRLVIARIPFKALSGLALLGKFENFLIWGMLDSTAHTGLMPNRLLPNSRSISINTRDGLPVPACTPQHSGKLEQSDLSVESGRP